MTKDSNKNIMEKFLDEDCNSDSSCSINENQYAIRESKPGLVEEFNSDSNSCSVEEIQLFSKKQAKHLMPPSECIDNVGTNQQVYAEDSNNFESI
jgi:hypothetical protein